MHDRARVTHQGVDQTALAGVGRPRGRHAPRLHEMPPEPCPAQQRAELRERGGGVPAGDVGPNRLDSAAQGAPPLIRDDRGRAKRTRIGQSRLRGQGERITLARGKPLPPSDHGATAAFKLFYDSLSGGGAAVAVNRNRLVGLPAHHDVLARRSAEAAVQRPLRRCVLERELAAGPKIAGHQRDRLGAFNPQRRDRAAARRR